MSNTTFVEFAGKKEYKCPKCKAPIRYAKYFGSDGKLLTTDGKEPYFDKSKKPMSNTGWPTNEMNKTMHQCEAPVAKESEIIDKSLLDKEPQVKDFESIVLKNAEEEAYLTAKKELAHLRGVRRACNEDQETDPPVQGMIFNKTSERLRRVLDEG